MSRNFEFNAPQFINFSNLNDPEADSFFDIKNQQEQESKNLYLTSLKESASQRKANEENKEVNSVAKDSSAKKPAPVLRKVLHEIVNQQIQTDGNTHMPIETPGKRVEREILLKFENLCLSETKPRRHPNNATELLSSRRKSHHMITRLDTVNHRTIEFSPEPVPVSVNKENTVETVTTSSITSNESVKSTAVISSTTTTIISDTTTMVNLTTTATTNTTSTNTNTANTMSTTKKVTLAPPVDAISKVKRHASPLYSTRKFMSLAEQVEHFYKDTPERFRSRPSKKPKPSMCSKPHTSIPMTPKLVAKFRQRKIDFPDEKQREEIVLEEMKKHQVKAYPLNEKILQGPSLNLKVPVIKKPATIPQPFALTEVKKKEPVQEAVFHFKAQPLPSAILQGPVGIPPRKIISPTVPTTPQIRVPLRFRVGIKTPEKSSSVGSDIGGLHPPSNTKVQPFSFDRRMKDLLQKKEDFIKKVIEEEKKTFNSFKAHPMPAFRNKCDVHPKHERTPHKTVPQPFNLTQTKTEKTGSTEQIVPAQKITPFKARPATILHQKPFIPKLQKHEVLLPTDFHLKTEKRAAERQKYDEKIKQKEEELNEALKQQKDEEERLERERALEDRKKAEFKAKPMPRYRAFEIHPADPEKLTLPQSPKFLSKTRVAKKQPETSEK